MSTNQVSSGSRNPEEGKREKRKRGGKEGKGKKERRGRGKKGKRRERGKREEKRRERESRKEGKRRERGKRKEGRKEGKFVHPSTAGPHSILRCCWSCTRQAVSEEEPQLILSQEPRLPDSIKHRPSKRLQSGGCTACREKQP